MNRRARTTRRERDAALIEVTAVITGLAGRDTPLRVDESGMGRLRALPTPAQRRAAKTGYRFSSESSETRIEIWDHIWRQSDLMEVRHQALYAYQHRRLARSEVRVILAWTDDCACWEHSDDLSKIYADVVEANPGWILPALKRWNRAGNPWKRRQSVVALIEYASKRKTFLPFETMIGQVVSLLDDDDYYVQKGVGWTIREIGNAYPAEMGEFMRRYAAHLSPQAWTGATKNLDAPTKAKLKAIRQGR